MIAGGTALAVGKPRSPTPPGFEWTALSSVARLETGHTPSRRHTEYWDGDIPWVGVRDATGNHGRTITSTKQTVTQAGIDNSSARILPAGTVCLSRTASVGFVVTMGLPMATSQDFVNWVCGPGLDNRYLKFVLQLEHHTLQRFASGTTHQTIYFPEAKAFHVLLPDVDEQRAIADVLAALDDKIESNRRLDQTTLALVRYEVEAWRSRTANWSATAFGDFTEVYGGATPNTKTPEYWGGDLPWATPSDVTALPTIYLCSTSRTLTADGLASCSAELHPAGTIFMTSRATIGAFAIPQVPCATNQGFIAVRPAAPEHRWFLLDEMIRRVPEMLDRANGSTFLELSRSNFKAMELKVPDDNEALRRLNEVLDPLHRRAAQAAEESNDLAALRDTLLPELLSGRLRVREAEDRVADAV